MEKKIVLKDIRRFLGYNFIFVGLLNAQRPVQIVLRNTATCLLLNIPSCNFISTVLLIAYIFCIFTSKIEI